MPQPKGIRTRGTPDWFARFLSAGGIVTSPGPLPPNQIQAITLWNNATDGSLLFVYSIFIQMSNGAEMQVAYVTEPIGSAQLACSRVNPQIGAPPGIIYWEQNGLTHYSLNFVGVIANFETPPTLGLFPQYIIPANSGLVLTSTTPGAQIDYQVYYVPMKDVNGHTAR